MPNQSKTRYQDSPWYVRLYRRAKYQPWSWFVFLKCLWYYWRHPKDAEEDDISIGELWSITRGLWQVKANWLYDWEDLKKELGYDPLSDQQTGTTG